MDAKQRLTEAIEHGRAGRKAQAQAILTQLVKENPQDADAWLWLAACFDDAQKQIFCLNKVLQIDPQNPRARKALEKLGAAPKLAPTPTEAPIPPALYPSPSTPPVSAPARPATTSSWINDADVGAAHDPHDIEAEAKALAEADASAVKPRAMRYSWWQVLLMATVITNDENYRALLRDPKGAPSRGYIWVLISGLISFLIAVYSFSRQLSGMVDVITSSSGVPVSELPFDVNAILSSSILGMVLLSPVFAGLMVLSVMISAGLFQVAARFLGGKGIFAELVYIMCAIYAPLYLVGSLINLLPFPGSAIFGLMISLYTIYLILKAIRAINDFGWGSSCVTMLAPGLFFALLGCLCSFLLSLVAPDLSGSIPPEMLPYP